MICPSCGAAETGVIDSRATDSDHVIRRRRECDQCHRRFTTYERIEAEPIFVRKKDGSREVFQRDKLVNGMALACKKSGSGVTELEQFAADLERRLQDEGRREVPAVELGRMVLSGLRKIDPVAYVRFASVYEDFDSVESFRQTIDRLENENP